MSDTVDRRPTFGNGAADAPDATSPAGTSRPSIAWAKNVVSRSLAPLDVSRSARPIHRTSAYATPIKKTASAA